MNFLAIETTSRRFDVMRIALTVSASVSQPSISSICRFVARRLSRRLRQREARYFSQFMRRK